MAEPTQPRALPIGIQGHHLRAALAVLGVDDLKSVRQVLITNAAVTFTLFRRGDKGGIVLGPDNTPVYDEVAIPVHWGSTPVHDGGRG